MNYQKQYANKINWQNKPSTSTPLNATNLNKMDTALWYMDNALYMLANAVGGGSSIRGGIISSIASNIITTHVTMRTGESLATDELLLLRSNAEGAGNNISIYTDEYSAEDYGLVDLDGEETSVTLTDTSILLLMLDTDEYTATVLGVMDENSGLAGLGIGKMTNYSSGVITTDIDLHRDPVIGDRILLYCSSNISVSNDSIKTYNDGVAVTTDIGPILPQTIVKGFNVLQCVAAIPDGIAWSVKLNVPIVAYSAGTGIMIDNNGVISNANPNYGENYDYKKIDSAIDDGNLGDFNGYCDNLIIDFHANAVSGGNAYTLTLVTGTSTIIREYAVLKDRSGNPFTRDINAGMILKCESNVSGSGTELDPVVVTVLEIGNWYVETGRRAGTAIGAMSTAEGQYNTVSGVYGHADGYGNTASGNSASAHGIASTASGDCSVADGSYTTASGANSSAHGDSTTASGIDSSASGEGTIAGYMHQTAMGRFNENKSGNLLEVGNGSDDDARSNALEVTADGHVCDGNGNDLQSVAALEASASGNPIIVNAQGIDAKDLSVELEPIQDLHGYDKPWVGGAGKNKLPPYNYTSITNDSIIYPELTSGEALSGDVSLPAGDYVLSLTLKSKPSTDRSLFIYPTGSSGELGYIAHLNTLNLNQRYEVPFTLSETTSIYAKLWGNGGGSFECQLQLESGSTATSYAPYSNICPISGRTAARVDDVGKNILAKAFVYRPDSASTLSDCFPIKAGNYTFSFDKIGTATSWRFGVSLFDKDGNALSDTAHQPISLATFLNNLKLWWTGNDSSSKTLAITIVEDCYIRIWFGGGNTTSAMTATQAQLEEGSTATAYEPYTTTTATIQFGQTVYGGTLNVTTGVLTVDRAIVDMGTMEWTAQTTNTENIYRMNSKSIKSVIDYPDSFTVLGGLICEWYDDKTARETYQKNVGVSVDNVGEIFVYDENYNTASSATAFTTFISGCHLCYKLKTPTTIQLTPTQLKLLEGYNYITADGEMDLVYVPESIFENVLKTSAVSLASGISLWTINEIAKLQGICYINLTVTGTFTTGTEKQIGTIPSGYRPKAIIFAPFATADGYGMVKFNTNGAVSITRHVGNSNNISILTSYLI